MPAVSHSNGTLQDFLGGLPSAWPWDAGILSMLSRSSAIFERATRIAASWRPGQLQTISSLVFLVMTKTTDVGNPTPYYAKSLSLDQRIDELRAQLPALAPGVASQLCLAHSLAHAAKIQLHSVFAQQNPDSRGSCLAAARAISSAAATAQIQNYLFVDPAIGVCDHVTSQLKALAHPMSLVYLGIRMQSSHSRGGRDP